MSLLQWLKKQPSAPEVIEQIASLTNEEKQKAYNGLYELFKLLDHSIARLFHRAALILNTSKRFIGSVTTTKALIIKKNC